MQKFNIEEPINNFFEDIKTGKISVFGESNMECKLAQYIWTYIFTSDDFHNKYEVETQRNVKDFGIDKKDVSKREMDIIVYSKEMDELYEIEIKYPNTKKNGAYPHTISEILKDIVFTEELKSISFTKTYFLIVSKDEKLCKETINERKKVYNDLYDYIRGKTKELPHDFKGRITGNYDLNWKQCKDLYYIFEEANPQMKDNM